MHHESIRVGILFSLTGCTAITEVGQYRSALLAIEQINKMGGIHNLPIEPFVEDIASDPLLAKKKARKLIEKDKVQIMVGPYTSACRKAVIPVLKQYNVLLFYPTLYEGNEQNNWIYYTGALPNQQLQFFIPWIISNLGMSFYLVGSDYIFPRITNQHMHELLSINGGQVVEESYAPLGTQNFEHILKEIDYLKPDIVFSTVVGDSAVSFYQQFYQAGFEQPICSPITAETEINAMNHHFGRNIYSSFPYFRTLNSKSNLAFIHAYEQRYGTKVISSVMQNTYNSIYLLRDALLKTNRLDTDSIRRALNHASFDAPQGYIRFDENNHHLWQGSRIGHITEQGDFEVVWESDAPIAPTPFISHAHAHLTVSRSFFNEKTENRVISREQLSVRRKRWKDYMPFLNQLSHYYSYQFFILDTDGILIEKIKDERQSWSNKGIEIGSNWLVDVRGKNGFGMAFLCKRPYIMQGEQHDYGQLKESVTAGIPIIRDKSCFGVLGILANLDEFSEISYQMDSFNMFVQSFLKFIEMTKKMSLFKNILERETNQNADGFFLIQNRQVIFSNVFAKQLKNKKPSLIQPLLDNLEHLDSTMERHLRRKVEDEVFDIELQHFMDADLIHIKPFHVQKPLNSGDAKKITFQDIIGMNSQFLNTIHIAKTAAQTDANVLIIGESGTGKELFANAIHNESQRGDKPFVAVNCGAISKELIYSELFGYVEGAFTGAKKGGKPGLFETATGGTVFLDEIGEMPLDLQATLLRVIQENKVTRIGSYQPIPIDVRIIAATNKNIMDEIAYKGNFRKDLYYRLSVFQLELVPLRGRRDDIPELAQVFLEQLNHKNHTQKTFSKESLELLKGYQWPGNVRELGNIVERAYYLSHFDSIIDVDHIDSYIFSPSLKEGTERDRKIVIDHTESEKSVILNYLNETGSNVSLTAKKLNISRTTLYKKLHLYNIEIKRSSYK